MIIKIVKVYLGLSLVVLCAVCGQFIFRQFLGLAYISQDVQAPSYVVGTNNRVLIFCTCHFQGSSVCFSFFCLLVSSVSVFHPDTRRAVVDTFFQAHLFSCAVEREGCCKRITLVCARSVTGMLGLPPLTVHTAQALGCSARNCLRPVLGYMHLPGLSRSGSGTQEVLRGADLVGPAFCALPRSEQLGCLASVVAGTYRLSCACCSVFWVYNWRPFLGRW